MLPQDEVDNNFESKRHKEKAKTAPTNHFFYEICAQKKQENSSSGTQKIKNVINIIF